MIKPINPIKQHIFYANNLLILNKDSNKSAYENRELLDNKIALALKNQILFKGNSEIKQRRELLQKAVEENNLPIKPQTLDFVLTSAASKTPLAIKYNKTGSKFFELFSRYLLHQKYPIKDEGELTDIIAKFIKSKNKARVLGDILPNELLPKATDKTSNQALQANSLNMFLGAIIYENNDGFKTAFEFLSAFKEEIFPKNLKLEESSFEQLAKVVEEYGYSWKDLYQETRFFNEQWHYRIHYKDMILAEANGGKHNHELREQCAQEALIKITSGEVDLDKATNENLTYTNYKIPTQKRIQELEEFCEKWNIKIKDMSLLHKAFLYGEMQDCSALAHCDTYEALEYVGDAVLGFCTHEILQDNLPKLSRQKICAKRHAFVNNKNLAILADKMRLMNYTINRNYARGEKRPADLFEAVVGAIFMDGGSDGINNVYKFLDDNFREEIVSI